MKNRKTVIVAFMLIAVMLLGVGYAALTDTLTIIGNAHIDMNQAATNFDENVYFVDAKVTETANVNASTPDTVSFTADDATFTANTLATLGDKCVFTFTVENDSNVAVDFVANAQKLSGVDNPSNSNETTFKVTYAYPNGQVIPSKGTIDVVVTVEVISPVTAATSATFGIEYTATAE